MKYFYIDTNQYRNLYSDSKGFSDDVHELICKLVDGGQSVLLMPQQTRDETERNRLRAWPEKQVKLAESEISKLEKKAKDVRDEYGEYKESQALAQEIDKHIGDLRDQLSSKATIFQDDNSDANIKMRALYQKAENLKETNEIYERSVRRFNKGNPPFDKKIGDHLIWESILDRLSNESAPELIFVSNDDNAWGKDEPDQWLVREFHDRTSGKVTFVKMLSEIPGLTTEEQAKIKAAEQRAIIENVLNDFVQSSDYSSAGANAQRLLRYKDGLDESDYTRIIDAACTNYSIYHSWFTSSPLKLLLEDPENEGYVIAPVETINQADWFEFERKIGTGLNRQHDQEVREDRPINLDDIPF